MAGRQTVGRRRDAPPEPDRIAPQPDPVPTPLPPRARRAGGHVDRGDGRGWVLDNDEEV